MAVSSQTFSDLGGGVSDLFSAAGQTYKEQGLQFEQQNYQAAAGLALQNKQYVKTSTAIQQGQQERQLYMGLGRTKSELGGAGLAESGNALDLLRESAQQGATATAALGQQGLINEAGYQEQADAYTNMANAANSAIKGAKLAAIGEEIGAGLKFAGSLATLGGG
jgi:hypothetical protein